MYQLTGGSLILGPQKPTRQVFMVDTDQTLTDNLLNSTIFRNLSLNVNGIHQHSEKISIS